MTFSNFSSPDIVEIKVIDSRYVILVPNPIIGRQPVALTVDEFYEALIEARKRKANGVSHE